jgi:hypothetical protein
MDTKEKIAKLTDSFAKDNWKVESIVIEFGDKIGIMAHHTTATNYDTKQPKKAYYLEGSHYEMGYMLGLLAAADIERMAIDFAELIVISFINGDKTSRSPFIEKILGDLLIEIVEELAEDMNPTLPYEFKQEMLGILNGCKKANPRTKVSADHLFALNMGIDILLSIIYSGDILIDKIPDLYHEEFCIPVMCNAFALFGEAAGGNHYMGRDFMFPTAGVFQDMACMIIYNPTDSPAQIPHISMTAPGMIGSIAAINMNGIGIGVDMSPSGNCTPENVGLNSLALNRHIIQHAATAEIGVELIKNTTRGVSWNHIIADGLNDKACIIETGSSTANPDFLSYPPEELKKKNLLPTKKYINDHQTVKLENGLMVRWNDYQYPASYLDFNPKLWAYYNKKHGTNKVIYPDAMTETGYINHSFTETNCPDNYYFAPQRETRNDFVMVINHFIIPEMRLFAMHPWTVKISASHANEIQWRYDELNNQVLSALKNGPIDYETAKSLIDFLAPERKWKDYYKNNPRSEDGMEIRIEGSVSICDLKNKTMESHYGYFCDEWVKLTLPEYIF